ncbi:MAG: prenyltransferase/squalene oxidase repeat-containing protein [Planctomycetota bacterium]
MEPTALASLALLAAAPDEPAEKRDEGRGTRDEDPTHLTSSLSPLTPPPSPLVAAVHEAADWLAEIQQPDGALGLSAELPTPCWGTAYGLLVWTTLGSHQTERERAVQWLLGRIGQTSAVKNNGILGHDTSIPGWPWIENTHAWLEPTAWAVLALRREGLSDHPRVREGVRLISNRAIPSGGWNYGNVSTFGTNLRAQPAPTGLALLALAGEDTDPGQIEDGLNYLLGTLPRVRSPRSLCWGLLGLEAWERRYDAAEIWLAESFSLAKDETHGSPSALDLAQLLLASSGRAPSLFGIELASGRQT